MTGVKLAGEIHKIRKELPVILCTGFNAGISNDNYAKKGIAKLIMNRLSKVNCLKLSVRFWIEKGILYDPNEKNFNSG